jgi:uncharacterized metal-binding protein
MERNKNLYHEETSRIVYACAGCADVGELADQVSRKLRNDGFASPASSCLVAIGAGLKPFVDAAIKAESIVTIDGCPVRCAKLLIEKIGISPSSIVLTELGVEKGHTTVTPQLTEEICKKIYNQHSSRL